MKIPNNINEIDDGKLILDAPVDSRKRDKLIHIRMTEQEKITAETMANYHDLPLSAYIRALIKQDMRRSRQVTRVKEAGGDID